MKRIAAAVLVLAFSMAAGTANSADNSNSDADYRAAQKKYLADNEKRPGWHKTESGLEYHTIKSASGVWPWYPQRSVVTVNYEGRLIDGQVFDSSYQRGQPATFNLSKLIKGWQEGIPLMRVGETWEFAVPADLAYGDKSVGPIRGGSTLLFKIELLDSKPE